MATLFVVAYLPTHLLLRKVFARPVAMAAPTAPTAEAAEAAGSLSAA